MNSDLISIVVPIYNMEKYLDKCVNSIISQTYKNIEIILVDDGSTDLSYDICEKYKKLDNRIKVYHKTNGGLSDAKNFGIKHASGKYIGFVDSDDWIEPMMYEILYKNIKEKNADIAICGRYIDYENGKSFDPFENNEDYLPVEIEFDLFSDENLLFCGFYRVINKKVQDGDWVSVKFSVNFNKLLDNKNEQIRKKAVMCLYKFYQGAKKCKIMQ